MTINDLHQTQIEAVYFILLMIGACSTVLCLTIYLSAKLVADAIANHKIEIIHPLRANGAYPRLLERTTN